MVSRITASSIILASNIVVAFSRRIGRAQRVPSLAQASHVFDNPLDSAAPIKRFVLNVAFAQTPRDLCFRQFRAQIESMRAIIGNAKCGE